MSHILIVEDEERMAATLKKGIEQAGFDTTSLFNGLAARAIDISEYDLVVLDWMLPGISGLDLLQHWRLQKFTTPILMLTARDALNDKVTGLDFGADDYVSKFFEWPELIARIKVLLRRVQLEETNVGTISLDRINQIFMENGQSVNLTATEYNILKYFYNRPGRLITRTSLLRSVYEDAKDPFSNVIERHIKSIRQKFEYDPITTIRGLGYRLNTSSAIQNNQN